MTRPGPSRRAPAGGAGPAGDRAGRPAGAGRHTAPRPAGRQQRRAGPAAAHGRTGSPPRLEDRFAPPYDLVTLRSPSGPLRARPDPGEPSASGAGRPMTFAARGRARPARRRRGPVRRFVRSYGWRAYAIPVLTVLTALCLVDVANGAAPGLPLPVGAGRPADPARATVPAPAGTGTAGTGAAAPKPRQTGIYVDDAGGGASRALPPTALPAGGAYSQRGGGRFDPVPGSSAVAGRGPLRRYLVEIEAGVAEDGPAFAAAVQRTLADPRSWGAGDRLSFQRVDSGPVDFRVSLTSSLTVRTLCGYLLPFETSCYNGQQGRAVINDARWVRGAVAYGGNLAAYRLYVINHEVGHALGNEHQPCPRAGTLAPVMMQQTLGLTTAGVGDCRPNPWPFP